MSAPRVPFRRAGFTLVELLVAMALMVILIGSVVFVFAKAQEIFRGTIGTADVYGSARAAFEMLESDLANAVKTADLEFFQDQPSGVIMVPNGHFDGGTEILAGANVRWHQGNLGSYRYAITFRHRTWDDATGQVHDNDSFYFKTVNSRGGQTRSMLVSYHLYHADPLTKRPLERPMLQREVQWLRQVGTDAHGQPRYSWSDVVSDDVCEFVTDFKIEIYLDNKRDSAIGRYFRIEEVPNIPASSPYNLGILNFDPDGTTIDCFYVSDRKIGSINADDGVIVHDGFGNGYFKTKNSMLQMLGPGDKLYLYDLEPMPGAPTPGASRPPRWTTFFGRDFTIKRIDVDDPLRPTRIQRVDFEEPLELNADQLQKDGKTDFGGFSYRAAWLPAAVRISLRIKDKDSLAHRTVRRVFTLLGS